MTERHNLRHPPPDVVLRGRFQVCVTRVELAADQLDRVLVRVPMPVPVYVELARLRDELRAAVEEATEKTPPLRDENGDEIPAWRQAG